MFTQLEEQQETAHRTHQAAGQVLLQGARPLQPVLPVQQGVVSQLQNRLHLLPEPVRPVRVIQDQREAQAVPLQMVMDDQQLITVPEQQPEVLHITDQPVRVLQPGVPVTTDRQLQVLTNLPEQQPELDHILHLRVQAQEVAILDQEAQHVVVIPDPVREVVAQVHVQAVVVVHVQVVVAHHPEEDRNT